MFVFDTLFTAWAFCVCVALFTAWVFVLHCFVHYLGVCFCFALFIVWAFVFVSLRSLLGCLPAFCFVDCLGVYSACLGWLSLV